MADSGRNGSVHGVSNLRKDCQRKEGSDVSRDKTKASSSTHFQPLSSHSSNPSSTTSNQLPVPGTSSGVSHSIPRGMKPNLNRPVMNFTGHAMSGAPNLWAFPPPPMYFPPGSRPFGRGSDNNRPPFLFSFTNYPLQQNIPIPYQIQPVATMQPLQVPISQSNKETGNKYNQPRDDRSHSRRHHDNGNGQHSVRHDRRREESSHSDRERNSKRYYQSYRHRDQCESIRRDNRPPTSSDERPKSSSKLSTEIFDKESSRPVESDTKNPNSKAKERTDEPRKSRFDSKTCTKSESDSSRCSRKEAPEKRTFDGQHKPRQASETKVNSDRDRDRCDTEELFTREISWIRCSPADPYYRVVHHTPNSVEGTEKLKELQKKFEYELADRNARIKASKPSFQLPPRKAKLHPPKRISTSESDSSCCSSEEEDDDEDTAFEELQRKKTHPWRLHDELWYNDEGEMNDGPVCRCSAKARRTGIRHGIYPGEGSLRTCDLNSNNSDRLFHYRLKITPLTNYTSKFPTTIWHDNHEFIFEGFSILAHSPILNYPPCKLIRFNIEYTITLQEEKFPSNFTIKDIDLITKYIFQEILELVDINWKAHNDQNGCPRFHLFPRFARLVEDDGKELLSANMVLQYLMNSNVPLVSEDNLSQIAQMSESEWISFAKDVKGMIVTYPGMKPSSVRVDQIDRETDENTSQTKLDDGYPIVVHFGIRPPQLSYAGNPKYQKAWRDYVKFRHLLANKPKVSYADRQTLLQKEEKLQEMRMKSDLKRDVTVIISSKGFYRTGLFCDVIQHSLLIPVVICHLRFHQSLAYLENILSYSFKDRYILQLALTHPSYRENFGTNPDHARNALTNCGIRQPYYGDRRVHFANTRKRGINMLINIMSRFGCPEETASNINHNERLEFLGDAVVEFLSSIHLFFMFPDLEEGGLATYRAAIVQNQHLAVLAKKLRLEEFMLYAHGSDLCHDLELRHAMANCFEALMGALFLDGDINVADDVFSNTLFGSDERELYEVWVNYPKHPIQLQDPGGDRHYVKDVPRLKELLAFEDLTGIEFTHIRLLARAFTHRSVGFNNLTLGSNQRMEFLGDTVLQLVASEYLYKFFPEHHEGHLSLLRSSLVNNKTQAVVCDDLGMTQFAVYNYAKGELKTKDRADLLEAFLGALYVDQGLLYCRTFCEVCFFPRLEDFIMNQDWNDPKSKLQQCCLTLRSIDGGEPDIPVYKVIESLGPTNTRVYKVAVYFRDQRLATGKGHSIQEAEMDAAANALNAAKGLFPQLTHQKRVIEAATVKRLKRC